MKLDELAKLVNPHWQGAFLRFIESGEAEEDFLAYLDQDEDCQKAVDLAFTAQAATFEDFARALSSAETTTPEERAAKVSATMAFALEEALDLPPEERTAAIQKAASTLKSAIKPERRKELRSLVKEIETGVAAANRTLAAGG